MGVLDDFEKDKIWDRMREYEILGMTREDLDNDDGIVEQLKDNGIKEQMKNQEL